MAGPRAKGKIKPIMVGRNSGYVYNYHVDALLATQGHKRNKHGGYDSTGPFYKVTTTLDNGEPVKWRGTWNGVDTSCTLCGVAGFSPTVPYVDLLRMTNSAYPSYAKATAGHLELGAMGYGKYMPGKAATSGGQFLFELQDLPSLPFRGFLATAGTSMKSAAKAWRALQRANIGRISGGAPIPKSDTFGGVPLVAIPYYLKNQAKKFYDGYKANGDNFGSEYLNYKFGWAPFIKDLQGAYKLMKTIDYELGKLRRENGKWVTRRGTLERDKQTEVLREENYPYAFANVQGATMPTPSWPGCFTQYKVWRTTTKRSWYCSQFRYYVPNIGSWQWDLQARAALFGLLPTPELIWNIMPWSWMVNWFNEVGKWLPAYFSSGAVGSPATRNQCVMTHVTTDVSAVAYTEQPAYSDFIDKIKNQSGMFSTTYSIESKVRSGGYSPYGRGMGDWDNLSQSQLAILAALGVSRGSR